MITLVIITVIICCVILLSVFIYLFYYNYSERVTVQSLSIIIVGLGTLISTIVIALKSYKTNESFNTAYEIYGNHCFVRARSSPPREHFNGVDYYINANLGFFLFLDNNTISFLGKKYDNSNQQQVNRYYTEIEAFRLVRSINILNKNLITKDPTDLKLEGDLDPVLLNIIPTQEGLNIDFNSFIYYSYFSKRFHNPPQFYLPKDVHVTLTSKDYAQNRQFTLRIFREHYFEINIHVVNRGMIRDLQDRNPDPQQNHDWVYITYQVYLSSEIDKLSSASALSEAYKAYSKLILNHVKNEMQY